MEEELYLQLFNFVKQMLHKSAFCSVLVNKDNNILNYLNMAIEESWCVYMDAKHKED